MTGRAIGLLAGGIAEGIGAGLVEDGKAKRAERMAEIEREYRTSERVAGQEFQTTERKGGEEFRTNERVATQGFTTSERQGREEHEDKTKSADRAHTRGLLSNTQSFTDADGLMWVRGSDGSAKPLTGPDGKQIRGQLSSKSSAMVKIGTKSGKLYSSTHDGAGDDGEPVVSMPSGDAAKIATATNNNATKIVLEQMEQSGRDGRAQLSSATKLKIADLSDATKRLAIEAKNGNLQSERELKEKLNGDDNETKRIIAEVGNLSKEEVARIRGQATTGAAQTAADSRRDAAQIGADGRVRSAQIGADARRDTAGARERTQREVDADDRIRREAQDQAEEEASRKAGWFSSDGSDFKETGGSRKAWINNRRDELIEQKRKKAGVAAPDDEESAAPASRGSAAGAEKPGGAGTRNAPFKASTQAHVDWFRANAPKGAVIEVDGEVYVK